MTDAIDGGERLTGMVKAVASFEAPRALILSAARGVREKWDYYPMFPLSFSRETGEAGAGEYSVYVGDPPGRVVIKNDGESVADISVADLLNIADSIESGGPVTVAR